jgi:hypothetical protein
MATRNFINLQPLGYQKLSCDTAQSMTIPAGATYAIIVPETQAVRFRDDGTDPTATIGFPVAIGQVLELVGLLGPYRFIAQTAGAFVNISYYTLRV